MSFPAHPNVGDTYTSDDTVWTFNGQRWDRTIIGPNNSSTYRQSHALVTTALLTRIAHLETIINQSLLIID